jgi:hypothetical protein
MYSAIKTWYFIFFVPQAPLLLAVIAMVELHLETNNKR